MIYLFYGKNTFAARQQVNKIIERYRKSTGDDFGLHRFDYESDPGEVINALSAQSMFTENSLVVLDHPSRNRDMAESLRQNLGRVPSSTVLVVYDPGIDGKTKWFKDLKSVANTKEFKPKPEKQLVSWVVSVARTQGVEVDRKSAQVLVDRVGDDQWRLQQEIEKLVLAGSFDYESIAKLTTPTPSHTVFELLDALAAGNEKTALNHYDDLRKQNIHELEILAMLGWQMRNLLVVAAGKGKAEREISKDHGINPYVVNKSRNVANKLELKDLMEAYERIMQTDWDIKSGGTADPEASLEQIMLHIGSLSRNK